MSKIENFWREPSHISDEVYRELLKSPPKHYCADLANCVDNPKDCRREQCFECMAIVGEIRRKNLNQGH